MSQLTNRLSGEKIKARPYNTDPFALRYEKQKESQGLL